MSLIKKIKAGAGLQVIELRSEDLVNFLELQGDVRELYDVVAIPQNRPPLVVGFMIDEIRRSIIIQSVKGIHPTPKKVETGRSLSASINEKEVEKSPNIQDEN